ncbi:hypothetical protein D3C84_1162840 [compost metagenome]
MMNTFPSAHELQPVRRGTRVRFAGNEWNGNGGTRTNADIAGVRNRYMSSCHTTEPPRAMKNLTLHYLATLCSLRVNARTTLQRNPVCADVEWP